MRIVSVSDDIRLGRSLEKRAWFMCRFTISSLARLSIDSLLKKLNSRNEVETVLRLSDKGISWGKQGFSWWRPWQRTLPFASIELSALYDVFQENSQPQVLICVESPVNGVRDSTHHVFAFRLYDVDDVRRFQRLFQLLTNTGERVTDPTVRLDNGERSPNARLAVRPSLEAENRTDRIYGDTIRHTSRKKSRNSVAFFDPNNNNENADRKTGSNHRPIQVIRSFSDSVSPDDPATTTNALTYYSPQPVRRKNAPVKTIGFVNYQMMPETAPTYAAAVVRTEDGRPIPANRKSKVASKSLSDDEDAKRTALDLTWTRNGLFSDKVASGRDGVVSNYALDVDGQPKPKPRTKITDQERVVTPTQVRSHVIPERTLSPTQVKRYVIPERTVTPIQLKSRDIGSSENTSEKTITPTPMKDQIQLERTITPTRANGQTPQNVDIIPVEGSSGLVRVYVPDYQNPVVPQKSLLKSRKDLDPELETTIVDSGRQKKSLSFNPSVLVNGTTGNALVESESPDQPDMDVTVHRILRHRHASWSDLSKSEGPDNQPTVRNRVMVRGLSLPTGVPVAPSAVRIRSTADPTTDDRKPHSRTNGRNGSAANHDQWPLDKREQVSEKFRKVQVVPSGSIPVDVITEEEDRRYDRRSPGPLQTTLHAVVKTEYPDRPTSNKKVNKTGAAAAISKGHRRMAYFGRRSGEPPLQYASDSEESARSRSSSHILWGQRTRRGDQVVHQTKNSVVDGGGHPSMAGQATVTPNGRLEVRVGRVRKEDERVTAVLKEGEERGKEIDREDVRRGRTTQVREGRRREVEDEIIRSPVTHDRHSDPVGRLPHSRRSQSVFDPRRGPPVIYNQDSAPPNGYLPGQLVIRSRSATRPILLSRTATYENGTVQFSAPMGESAGGHQENGSKKINRFHQSDQTTQLQNGGVSGRYKRKSNFF